MAPCIEYYRQWLLRAETGAKDKHPALPRVSENNSSGLLFGFLSAYKGVSVSFSVTSSEAEEGIYLLLKICSNILGQMKGFQLIHMNKK